MIERESWESAQAAYDELHETVEPLLTSIHDFSTNSGEIATTLGSTAVALSGAITSVEQLNQELQSLVEALEVAGGFLPATAAAAGEVKMWQAAADKAAMGAVDAALAAFQEAIQYRMWSNQSRNRVELPEGGADALAKMMGALNAAADPGAEALAAAVQLS